MTNEELDKVRAGEANRIILTTVGQGADYARRLAETAARLARENWKPVDPDLVEARKIVFAATLGEWTNEYRAKIRDGEKDDTTDIVIALAALKRGRELALSDEGKEG